MTYYVEMVLANGVFYHPECFEIKYKEVCHLNPLDPERFSTPADELLKQRVTDLLRDELGHIEYKLIDNNGSYISTENDEDYTHGLVCDCGDMICGYSRMGDKCSECEEALFRQSGFDKHQYIALIEYWFEADGTRNQRVHCMETCVNENFDNQKLMNIALHPENFTIATPDGDIAPQYEWVRKDNVNRRHGLVCKRGSCTRSLCAAGSTCPCNSLRSALEDTTDATTKAALEYEMSALLSGHKLRYSAKEQGDTITLPALLAEEIDSEGRVVDAYASALNSPLRKKLVDDANTMARVFNSSQGVGE